MTTTLTSDLLAPHADRSAACGALAAYALGLARARLPRPLGLAPTGAPLPPEGVAIAEGSLWKATSDAWNVAHAFHSPDPNSDPDILTTGARCLGWSAAAPSPQGWYDLGDAFAVWVSRHRVAAARPFAEYQPPPLDDILAAARNLAGPPNPEVHMVGRILAEVSRERTPAARWTTFKHFGIALAPHEPEPLQHLDAVVFSLSAVFVELKRRAAGHPPDHPTWDGATGRLTLGHVVLRTIEKPAPAVRAVLDGFESYGWPGEMDAPKRAAADAQQLHLTVKSLNSGKLRVVKFHGRWAEGPRPASHRPKVRWAWAH